MNISGFQTMTLLDYPEHVACTVFTGGCNFRCPFCHNGDIVLYPENGFSEDEIFAYLRKRKNLLGGVCITGGEPTLNKDLPEFAYKIKNIGLKVKLDTNGSNPAMLQRLIDGNLIDYLAMDIKAGEVRYSEAVGVDVDMSKIKQSIEIIKNATIKYEFRSTLVKGIHTLKDADEIGSLIKGARICYLQNYKDNEKTIANLQKNGFVYESFSILELEEFAEIMNKYCETRIRGIDE